MIANCVGRDSREIRRYGSRRSRWAEIKPRSLHFATPRPKTGRRKKRGRFGRDDRVMLDARGLAAVDGGVADVLALDDVDDVFGDVGGVIADALEVLGDEDEFERGKDDAGIAHHVGKQFTENLVAVVVHLIVGGEDALRELHVATD